MAVKASDIITLSTIRDVKAAYRFYKLQSSTAAAPSKPTALGTPPSGWSSVEPSYTQGSTNSLYTVDLTVFTDNTFSYSEVSLSSSYEAAKAAYNKAVGAEKRVSAAEKVLENSEPFISGTQTAATGSWSGIAPFSELTDGQKILYWLPYAGSGNATLNLTLSTGMKTGAIACYYGGATRITTHYPAGSMIRLTYRKEVSIAGSATKYTGWWADANYDSGNTFDRIRYQGAVKASAAISAGNIIVGNSGGYHHLKTGGGFDPSYPILYAGSAIASGATGTNNYTTIPFAVTKTQSITLTAYKAVYIKGTLTGPTFTPVSIAPLTQTVPSSDDGYYYLLLGTAYSATAMYLLAEHPISRYKNGAFKTMAQIASECAAWAYNNNATYIDGGNLYTGTVTANAIAAKSITADKLDVKDLSALNATIAGFKMKEFELSSESNGSSTPPSLRFYSQTNAPAYSETKLNTGLSMFSRTWTLNGSSYTPWESFAAIKNDTYGVAMNFRTVGYRPTDSLAEDSYLDIQKSIESNGKISLGVGILGISAPSVVISTNGEYHSTDGIILGSDSTSASGDLYLSKNQKFLYGTDTNGKPHRLTGITTANSVLVNPDGCGNTAIYSGASSVVLIGRSGVESQGFVRLGNTFSARACAIQTYWADSSQHHLAERAADGLTSYFGFAGTSNYASVTVLRGRTCKYSNSSGTTTLSDQNLKKDIADLTGEKYDVFFDSLKPREYKYILGTSGRPHCGFITQEVEEALESAGMTTADFAGVNIIPINAREQEEGEDGELHDVDGSTANHLLDKGIKEEHDLLYNEFIALNTAQIQKQKTRITELENKIALLEEKISALENSLSTNTQQA